MYKIAILILLALSANASNLIFSNGEIKAHTEVFGDSAINPLTKQIESNLSVNDKIESIKGTISIMSLSLKSDNADRDEHMYKVLNANTNPTISFKLKNITQIDKMYLINGVLTFNGISKEIESSAAIKDSSNALNMSGSFSINLTDFNIEPPTLLFLTVRNQIDITYDLTYKKR